MSTLTGDESLGLPEFDAPPDDPLALAADWLAAAEANRVREPFAAVLATADGDGRPSTRTVMVKEMRRDGAVFTTDTASRKAAELAVNPRASLTFYWRETLQQLTVAGRVVSLPDADADALFQNRPRGAQAASIMSRSGEPLESEAKLSSEAAALERGTETLNRPDRWVGYLLVPDRIEFWHGRANRLHRRLAYAATTDGWTAARLQP